MVGRIVVGLVLALGAAAAALGCESEDDGSSSPDDGSDSSGSQTCRLEATLSGAIERSLGKDTPACASTARTVSFVFADGSTPAISVLLSIDDLEKNQTGTFSASIDVSRDSEQWRDAACTVNVTSNVKTESAADGGAMFDRYLVKGNGSCTTPANFAGTVGGSAPITIAPFTFTTPMLFY